MRDARELVFLFDYSLIYKGNTEFFLYLLLRRNHIWSITALPAQKAKLISMLDNPICIPVDVIEDKQWTEFRAEIRQRWTGELGDRKQDRSKRREQEILRAALRVFARDGISRARIGDIAAEAGMPVSSLYEYFPSKEDLAYAVPAAHLAEFFTEFFDAAECRRTAGDRLRLYLWLAADFARRNPEWARTFYLEIWPSVLISESPLRHAIDDYARIIVYLIRQGELNGEWSEANDPYEVATILNGSINHLLITWLLYRRPRDLMKSAGTMIDQMMRLLT